MKYFIYNKLSKSGHKKTSSQMLDVSSLNKQFYQNLSSDDEVELHGGDGTINKFINNCIVYPKLTIVPSGTGNDLSRSLSSEYAVVNVYDVNGTKFINGFDVGFGAQVCSLVESDMRKGKLSYIRNVYLSLKQSKPFTCMLTVDDQQIQVDNGFMIVLQNGKYFGSGMKIAPDANISQDKLSITVISQISNSMVAILFPSIFWGKHLKFEKYVKTYSGQKINVKLKEQYIAECDGELITKSNQFTINRIGNILIKKK